MVEFNLDSCVVEEHGGDTHASFKSDICKSSTFAQAGCGPSVQPWFALWNFLIVDTSDWTSPLLLPPRDREFALAELAFSGVVLIVWCSKLEGIATSTWWRKVLSYPGRDFKTSFPFKQILKFWVFEMFGLWLPAPVWRGRVRDNTGTVSEPLGTRGHLELVDSTWCCLANFYKSFCSCHKQCILNLILSFYHILQQWVKRKLFSL